MVKIFLISIVFIPCLSRGEIMINFDLKSTRVVLEFLKNGIPVPDDFNNYQGVKLLIQRNKNKEAGLTIDNFIDRLKQCKTGICEDAPGTRLLTLKDKLDKVIEFCNDFEKKKESIAQEAVNTLSEHMPRIDFNFNYDVHLIAGGNTDAFVEIVDGKPHMLLELSEMIQEDNSKTWINLNAYINHELWHSIFREYINKHWTLKAPDEGSKDFNYNMIFSMLDEGYGHYMSLLSYTGSKKNVYKNLKSKATKWFSDGFFEMFNKNIIKFIKDNDQIKKQEMLDASCTGNFWEKWGAMTGDLVISTIDMKQGRQKLLSLFEKEPFSIWLAYQEIADKKYKLNNTFIQLIEDASKK